MSRMSSMGGKSLGGETGVVFSEQNYVPEPGQTRAITFLKMEGKPGITKPNLAAIPLSLLFLMLTGADVLQSQIYILYNEDFYDKTKA